MSDVWNPERFAFVQWQRFSSRPGAKGYRDDGVQNELDLNALLEMPQLTSLVDESTVFDWKSLLTEKVGANLRNELAHGLIE